MATATGETMTADGRPKYVLSVDIGSTSMRCFVVDAEAKFIASASQPIETQIPAQGHVELDPEVIWSSFVLVVKDAMKSADIVADQVSSLGIATARGTFTSWHRETGELLHPFISWRDTRSASLAQSWNRSIFFRGLSGVSRVLHGITRANRFLAMAVIEFTSYHMCIRCSWVLKNMPEARALADRDLLLFGTIDTFLIWRLSGGKVHGTDVSNASATALYDPFVMDWSTASCKLMGVPKSSLPTVFDTSAHICTCDEDIFGGPIEVHCVAADQQSAAFGQLCWDSKQAKCTIGTGSFVNIATSSPHASGSGFVPVVGWRIKGDVTFLAEGHSASAGSCVDWAREMGWFDDVADLSRMVRSVEDSGGVYFVPAFSGIESPVKDFHACCSVFGLTPATKREHLVRALLESLAFRVSQLVEVAEEELHVRFESIRVDGGVSQNDFLLQTIADLTGCKVVRAGNLQTTALGVAFFAGLSSKFWQSKEEFRDKVHFTDTFYQKPENVAGLEAARHMWEKAVDRSRGWYKKQQ